MALSAHRSRAPAMIAPGTSSDASPWGSLQADLIGLVGWRVLAGDLLDYVRLRAVCSHWRSSTVSPRGRGVVDPRFHPRRWMLLPQGHGLHASDDKLTFLNLSTGFCVRTSPSLLEDHHVIDSLDGLLLVQHQFYKDKPIRLLHPLTCDIAELPPLPYPARNYFNLRGDRHLSVTDVTSLSVSADGVVTVVITLFTFSRVVFATTRDQQWSTSKWDLSNIRMPAISSQGKVYALRNSPHGLGVQIFQMDPPMLGLGSSSSLSPKLVATCPIGKIYHPFYLVECDSEILVIGHSIERYPSMLVYRLNDLIQKRVTPVTRIGGNALFLDVTRSRSVSCSAVPRIITGDTIVRRCPRGGYPLRYHPDSNGGTWSAVAGGSVNNAGPVSRPCNLIYCLYDGCGCMQEPYFMKVKRKR